MEAGESATRRERSWRRQFGSGRAKDGVEAGEAAGRWRERDRVTAGSEDLDEGGGEVHVTKGLGPGFEGGVVRVERQCSTESTQTRQQRSTLHCIARNLANAGVFSFEEYFDPIPSKDNVARVLVRDSTGPTLVKKPHRKLLSRLLAWRASHVTPLGVASGCKGGLCRSCCSWSCLETRPPSSPSNSSTSQPSTTTVATPWTPFQDHFRCFNTNDASEINALGCRTTWHRSLEEGSSSCRYSSRPMAYPVVSIPTQVSALSLSSLIVHWMSSSLIAPERVQSIHRRREVPHAIRRQRRRFAYEACPSAQWTTSDPRLRRRQQNRKLDHDIPPWERAFNRSLKPSDL